MTLPMDSHVHTEWSWDTPVGAMARTCARAVELGLPAIAFTDHLDFTTWQAGPELSEEQRQRLPVTTDGLLTPPPLDVEGYLECVERCRRRFPELVIMTGVELGQPHRHDAAARALLGGRIERINGSLHTLLVDGVFHEPAGLYRLWPADDVVRAYLAEIPQVVAGSQQFAVLCHLDYPLRHWPADRLGPFDPYRFEAEFRHALGAVAAADRALELNTGGELKPWLVQWWREEGGRAITFGSDTHSPDKLAQRFAEAMALAEAHGFGPGRHPSDPWRC